MTNFLNVMSECACVSYTETLARKKIKFIKKKISPRKYIVHTETRCDRNVSIVPIDSLKSLVKGQHLTLKLCDRHVTKEIICYARP